MTAQEFMGTWKRMCHDYPDCRGCPVWRLHGLCPAPPIDDVDTSSLVALVEQWAETDALMRADVGGCSLRMKIKEVLQ